jgi:hypothetical protein
VNGWFALPNIQRAFFQILIGTALLTSFRVAPQQAGRPGRVGQTIAGASFNRALCD